MEINWNILQPIDSGALVGQGFQTGMAMVKQAQRGNALRSYLANPDDPQAYNALAYIDPGTASAVQQQRLLQRKVTLDQQDRDRAVSLGHLAVSDPRGAHDEAVASGDFELAKQFGEMDDTNRKRSAEFWQQAGPIAFKLKQTNDPQQRQELWAQARPILESQGADPGTLDRFDPTNNTQLDAAITLSQKIGDLIDQGKITWHQQGEQPSFATDSMGRPVGSQNPYGQHGSSVEHPAAAAVANTLSGGGLPPPVVAGFLGNFHVEGGYGGASGDGGTAHGIAQLRGERATNFERVIGKPVSQASPEEQARFTLWEMQNPEAAGMTVQQRDAILAAKTPGQAASLIDQFYERSSGEHRQRRVEAAERAGGHDSATVKAQAAAAIAAGADPAAVRARAAGMGVAL